MRPWFTDWAPVRQAEHRCLLVRVQSMFNRSKCKSSARSTCASARAVTRHSGSIAGGKGAGLRNAHQPEATLGRRIADSSDIEDSAARRLTATTQPRLARFQSALSRELVKLSE